MHRLTAERPASCTEGGAPTGPESVSTKDTGISDGTTPGGSSPALGSWLARFALTFTGMALFLCLLAAVGLVVELLAGIGGLWIVAGVFLVVLMAALRDEGVL